MLRPIIPVTILFAAGVYAGSCQVHVCFFIVLLVFILYAVSTKKHRLLALILCSFMVTGALYFRLYHSLTGTSPLDGFTGRYVSLSGVVVDAEEKEGIITLKVKARLIRSGCTGALIGKRAFVLVKGREIEGFSCGDVIEARGTLMPLCLPKNPGLPDYETALRFQGITHVLRIHRRLYTKKSGEEHVNPFVYIAHRIKKRMESVIYRNLPCQHASLLCGIVFGDRSQLPEDLNTAFSDTGTLHILAASGMNVGIIVLSMLGILSRLGISRKWGAAASLPLVVVYTYMAGCSACIVRASIMASFGILALILERENDMTNILFLAALIMLIWNPYTLFDIGFQLSFAAVLAIAFISPLLARYMARFTRPVRGIAELFLLSLGIQVVLIPVLAWHFNKISLLSPLCNIVIVPPAGILLNLGILEGLLGIFCYPLSIPFAFVNGKLLAFMIFAARLFASIPFCSFEVARPSGMCIIFYYGALALLLYYLQHRRLPTMPVRPWVFIPAALILGGVFLWNASGTLKITILDVGHGDSIWIRMPSGEHVLIDGGDCRNGYDMGRAVVLPVLRAHGVQRLDMALLSHLHSDHSGGLIKIAESNFIKEYGEGISGEYSGECKDSGDNDREHYDRLLKILRIKGIKPFSLRAGDEIGFPCGASMKVLAPSGDSMPSPNANDDSLVVMLQYGAFRLLCMGDLEEKGEKELAARGYDLACSVLKVGHHGSNTSTSDSLIQAASPEAAVISVGRSSTFGHPSPAVLRRLEESGIHTYRTDRDGAVEIITDGRRMEIRCCRNKRGEEFLPSQK